MPVIRVEMFKRTLEQKRELVKELTDSFVKACGGNKEAIKILITEVEKEDWASEGVLTSDKEKE
jgi:4-oxalocrotonate tautomerase